MCACVQSLLHFCSRSPISSHISHGFCAKDLPSRMPIEAQSQVGALIGWVRLDWHRCAIFRPELATANSTGSGGWSLRQWGEGAVLRTHELLCQSPNSSPPSPDPSVGSCGSSAAQGPLRSSPSDGIVHCTRPTGTALGQRQVPLDEAHWSLGPIPDRAPV
jgi:hypothetical protein